MKLCLTCNLTKDRIEFATNKSKVDGLQTECRPCKRRRDAEYYARKPGARSATLRRNRAARKRAIQVVLEHFKTHPCVDCGIDDIRVLEFDHVTGVKLTEVARMVKNRFGVDSIKREIAKCQVRCANCHRRKTYRGSWRDQESSNGRTQVSETCYHGSNPCS